jgi:AcrR family transcriptional regulator
MSRRDELLDQVADHLIEHGLINLTLRPLAAAIGTSDRMLVYHFHGRDALVSAAVGRVSDRAVEAVRALPAARTVRAGVRALWAAYQGDPMHGYLTVYCQAASTGLIGREPYLSDAREANERWAGALAEYLLRCGASPRRVRRVVRLVDSALYGFHLDLTTDRPEWLTAGVDDLAQAAHDIAVG